MWAGRRWEEPRARVVVGLRQRCPIFSACPERRRQVEQRGWGSGRWRALSSLWGEFLCGMWGWAAEVKSGRGLGADERKGNGLITILRTQSHWKPWISVKPVSKAVASPSHPHLFYSLICERGTGTVNWTIVIKLDKNRSKLIAWFLAVFGPVLYSFLFSPPFVHHSETWKDSCVLGLWWSCLNI